MTGPRLSGQQLPIRRPGTTVHGTKAAFDVPSYQTLDTGFARFTLGFRKPSVQSRRRQLPVAVNTKSVTPWPHSRECGHGSGYWFDYEERCTEDPCVDATDRLHVCCKKSEPCSALTCPNGFLPLLA